MNANGAQWKKESLTFPLSHPTVSTKSLQQQKKDQSCLFNLHLKKKTLINKLYQINSCEANTWLSSISSCTTPNQAERWHITRERDLICPKAYWDHNKMFIKTDGFTQKEGNTKKKHLIPVRRMKIYIYKKIFWRCDRFYVQALICEHVGALSQRRYNSNGRRAARALND